MKNKTKQVLLWILLVLVSCSSIILFSVHDTYAQQEQKATDTLAKVRVDKIIELEYENKPIDFLEYVHDIDENIEVTVDSPINTSDQVGKYDVQFNISYISDYGKVFTRNELSTLTIVDTESPIIRLNEDETDVNRVYDPIDGDLVRKDTEELNSYTIHDGKVIATDRSGNRTEVELKPVSPVTNQSGTTYNFDSIYTYREADMSNCQELINNNYMVFYYGDYYHLATSSFLNMYHTIKVGSEVIINNTRYICTDKQHGSVNENGLTTDDGINILDDGITQLITNDGAANNRWILYLKVAD